MKAEDIKNGIDLFRGLANNCSQILKTIGADKESIKSFEKAGQILLQECFAMYCRKKEEEKKDGN